jgi:EAL and modified HD-GYP domain-containing signal transduction protein
LLEDMPLSAKVKGALMGRDNAYRPIYELILNYENADWGKVATLAAQLGLQEQEIPEAYEEAIKWVESPFWF